MKDLLYLKDEQLKGFIEKIFVTYRESFSDPKKILKKYQLGTAHHKSLHLISFYKLLLQLNTLKFMKRNISRAKVSLLQIVIKSIYKDFPFFFADIFFGIFDLKFYACLLNQHAVLE